MNGSTSIQVVMTCLSVIESKVSYCIFQKIQDFIRSIKLESSQTSSGPNESKNDATLAAEMSFPDDGKSDTATTQTNGKRKKQKEGALVNKGSEETQEKKVTKRVQSTNKDSSKSKDKENMTAAEIPALRDQVDKGQANATDGDIEHHLLSISARSYKRLLVGMDTGDPWFVQASAVTSCCSLRDYSEYFITKTMCLCSRRLGSRHFL